MNFTKTTKLKPKNDYIRQLIFGKVNSAYVLRKRNPEFFKEVIKEVETLFKSLPQDYLEQNPNLLKIKKIISEEI